MFPTYEILRSVEADLVGCFFYVLNITLRNRKCFEHQHQEEVVSGGYYDGRSHFLHGRVFCGDCGAMMTRRTVRCSSRPDNKETHKVWTCKERHKGRKGNGCLMRNIPEEELLAAICFQMGLPNAENFPVGRFRREIERVEVMDNGVWVVPRRMVKTA